MPKTPIMRQAMLDQSSFHSLVIDSLEEQIAVVDRDGTIVYVNRAWKTFGLNNGLPLDACGIGGNYLKVCNSSNHRGDSIAGKAEQGLLELMSGKRASFYFEYPCHSPEEKRWFLMRATPLHGDTENYFVISHHNITQRKLVEEQIEYLSLHDPLTGLSNRRHFDQFAANEWRRSVRNQSPVGFVMFDLDHFKDYNDAQGHPAGDRCLVLVAQVLRAYSGRPGDLAVRYGGEEFGLLLGNADTEKSAKLAEAVRGKVYDLNICYSESRRITISAGVASTIPDNQRTVESLVLEADQALYRAKHEGRNRIVCAQSAGT